MNETTTRADAAAQAARSGQNAPRGADGQTEQPGQSAQSDPQARVAELEAALEAAKAEAATNWDKYLRERADMENYKKRIERTYADLAKQGRKELILKVLSAVDNLERALAYEGGPNQEVDARNLATGLRMTYLQFKEILNSEGLKEVKCVGEPFNPALHEAIATETAPDKPEGEVLAEVQKGYTLGEELLRPARVKVATKG